MDLCDISQVAALCDIWHKLGPDLWYHRNSPNKYYILVYGIVLFVVDAYVEPILRVCRWLLISALTASPLWPRCAAIGTWGTSCGRDSTRGSGWTRRASSFLRGTCRPSRGRAPALTSPRTRIPSSKNAERLWSPSRTDCSRFCRTSSGSSTWTEESEGRL